MKSYYTLLILLTVLITPIVLFAQWDTVDEELKCKEFKTEIDKRGDKQVPVFDESNVAVNTITGTVMESLWEKECILDVKVRAQAREVLDEIMQDTIEYLSTGFKYEGPGGSPVEGSFYVENVSVYLSDISAREREIIVNSLESGADRTGLPTEGFGESPFLPSVKAVLDDEQSGEQTKYNLKEVIEEEGGNVDDFIAGDVTQGGITGWLAFTQNPYNNPVDSYIIIKQEIQDAERAAQMQELRQLDWGEGTLPTRDDDGNVTQPASVNRDLLTAVTNAGIESLQSTDEVGEIRDQEAEVLHETIVDKTPLGDVVVDANDGYEVGDGLSAGSLNIPDFFDIDIFDDIFDLQELLDGLLGDVWDGQLGQLSDLVEGLIDEDGTFSDLLAALTSEGIDPSALLEQFDIIELVDEFSLEEIIDAYGINTLVDQYGIESIVTAAGGVQNLIRQAGGANDLMSGLDRGQLRDLLEGMGADLGSGDIETQGDLEEFLSGEGISWSSLSEEVQNNLLSFVREE